MTTMPGTNNRLDLSGKWLLRWYDGQRGGRPSHTDVKTDPAKWMEAQVPGEVHLDLIKAGLIQEPTLGTNCLAARWVEEFNWTYRTTFTPPEEAVKNTAWLVFEGLDYSAKIYLNGTLVGEHSNFFYPCKLNVTGKLLSGENVLIVQLESGLRSVAEKSVKGYYGGDTLHKRIWLRKPQCSFGWDWSTRLINVGIHKPAALEWNESARVDQVALLTALNDDCSEGTLRVKMFVEGVKEEKQKGEVVVKIAGIAKEFSQPVEIAKGMQCLETNCAISKPRLWWPAGQGDQPLYTVSVRLVVNGMVVGESVRKTGFRKVRINQDPHPEGGQYFIIELNGRKVFAKGANFVPADMVFARIDRARYQTLVDRALEANFNMLRVWGGGLYESDDFYGLCDEKGIMVWQEFIFACAAYPTTDEEFMRNVKAEAIFNIRRLSGHPSLVVWCGNNENEWLSFKQEKGVIYPDYSLYHQVLPRLLKQEDPTVYYQPSSPMSPDLEDMNKNDVGDQHPWSVGFANVDFRDYRKMNCRFPNEGGILGPTSLKSMQACLPEGQKHVNSFAWQVHDNEMSALDKLLGEWLKMDPRQMAIEDFTYYCGLVQGEGLREYIDNFRRRKFASASAIFWMYNDCWPATRSWTIVDYYLHRTPAFYPVRRAFAPVSVAVTRENDTVNIYGINDTNADWKGGLRFGVFALAGEYVIDENKDVVIKANASNCLASFNAEAWDKSGIEKSLAFARLSEKGVLVARNRLFLPKFHEMSWPNAEVSISRKKGYAVFKSNTFAWGVCIDLEGKEAVPDNFFDVWPGMEYCLPWPEDKQLPAIIRIGNLLNV
jgi:beta-mannosidase